MGVLCDAMASLLTPLCSAAPVLLEAKVLGSRTTQGSLYPLNMVQTGSLARTEDSTCIQKGLNCCRLNQGEELAPYQGSN